MPSTQRIRRASASAPGTCGELAQGMLDGIVCMVTCPIDLYSTATVELEPGDGVISAPPDCPKAKRAAGATLEWLGEKGTDARLLLESPLPRGKGMASSTADVAAAVVATAAAAGRKITPLEISEIALSVEPSDGVMFPGVSVYDHREGRVSRGIGQPPPMFVVVLDFGGSVDTLEFNLADRDDALNRLEPRMTEAVSLIEDGILRGDPLRIGRGASVSAVANQEMLFNPHLEAVLELSREAGATGVNVAHSGTVIGMLFGDDAGRAETAAALARRRLTGLEAVMCRRIIGGGIKVH